MPLLFGIVYGLYGPTIVRRGGAPSWGQFWLGLISGVVVAALTYALIHYGHRLGRGLRALAWGAFAGSAIAFLFSLSGASVFSSVLLGLFNGAGALLAAYYLFYTHDDARRRAAPS